MKRLGVSIYPDITSLDDNKNYLTLAAKYGCKRIFTNLLSDGTRTLDDIVSEFKEIIDHATDLGMEVIADVAPNVYKDLNISHDDLSFFKKLGVSGIRLDEGFGGGTEAELTWNKDNLKIEVNASTVTKEIDNIIALGANKENLIACHNFYPQRYTGLSYDIFMQESKKLKELGILLAAFVSSNADNSFGPWPVNEGLPTLEIHRDLPIDTQARHLYATGLIDDIIISNCYATEDEFKSLASIDPNKLTFGIELNDNVLDIEKEIMFTHHHFVRGDISSFMARSTFPRITYKDADIEAHDTKEVLERGDVIIVNNGYGRYKGELHIVLEEMPNDGRKNVVGHIPKNELIMLDFIKPWIVFAFTQK